MNNNSEIAELNFEKILWGIFIFISALNIYGDNIQQLFLIDHNPSNEEKAKDIFIFTLVISILIYIYFAYRNFNNIKKAKQNNIDITIYNIRFIGSIFIVVGVIMVLYFEVKEETPIGTPIT